MKRAAIYLTLINAALIACGTTNAKDVTTQPVDNPRQETSKPVQIDDELILPVQSWVDDCVRYSSLHCGSLLNKIDAVKVVDEFEDSPETIGRCVLTHNYVWRIMKREVSILRSILDKPYTLQAVLAHEFGHCIFLLEHDESDPKRLMQPSVDYEYKLEKTFDLMIRKFYAELFLGVLPRIEGFDDE